MRNLRVFLANFTVVGALLLGGCSMTADSTADTTADSTDLGASSAVLTGAVAELAYADLGIEEADLTFDVDGGVGILLSDDSTVGGAGVSVDGDTITITKAGTYRIVGALSSGSIVVDAPGAVVNLVLDGVDITASGVAALEVADADQVVVWLAEGSVNAFSDASGTVVDESVDGAPNATLFSTSDLWIAGTGALSVTAHAADGITSKDSFVMVSGSVTVESADDGLRGKDHLVILDGEIVVDSGGDALRSDNEAVVDDPEAPVGVVWIGGGSLDLTAGSDAVDAARQVTVEAGDVVISAGDDGLHSDEVLRISGGTIDIAQSFEGIEGAYMYLSGGDVTVVASDDGINVAGGTEASSATAAGEAAAPMANGEAPPGGRPAGGPGLDPAASDPGGEGQFATTEPVQDLANLTVSALVGGGFGGPAEGDNGSRHLEFSGGTYIIDSDSDGVDVNGSMTMTGGTLIVSGTSDARNGALDVDDDFLVTGGTLAANGMATMAVGPDEGSTQASLAITFSGSLPAGTLITVSDSEGQFVASFVTEKVSQSFIYSSVELVSGNQYTVSVGGETDGTVTGWLVTSGKAIGGDAIGAIAAQ